MVKEAYCPQGHSLISKVKIKAQPGLHFIYIDEKETEEIEVVISAFVGERDKEILKGTLFPKGTIAKILCPTCREELPILFNCECGAPIYFFYIDNQFDHNLGQSFCSRIGCIRASQLRHSEEALKELIMVNNC